jgi:hypothetical protein
MRFRYHLSLFLIVFSTILLAQSRFVGDMRSYKMPKEMVYTTPETTKQVGNKKKKDFFDKFYPIGWSTNGRFAYLVVYANPDPTAPVEVELFIKNMLHQENVWTWRGSFASTDEEGKPLDINPLEFIWDERYSHIRKKLDAYDIVQTFIWTHKVGCNFVYRGDTYETTTTRKNMGGAQTFDIKISCSLGSRILRYSNDDETLSAVNVLGCIQSPFEERAALIIEEIFVTETGQSIHGITLLGCDLMRNYTASN